MCNQGKDFKFCSCARDGQVPISYWKFLSSSIEESLLIIGETMMPYGSEDFGIESLASKIEVDLNGLDAFDFDFTPYPGDFLEVGIPIGERGFRLEFRFEPDGKWRLDKIESEVNSSQE